MMIRSDGLPFLVGGVPALARRKFAIGSAGMPLDLAMAGPDYDTAFAAMQAAGMTLHFPTSIYEVLAWDGSQVISQVSSTSYEGDLLAPPVGTADSATWAMLNSYGIKLIVPASLIYPDPDNLPTGGSDPLVAMLAAEVVAAVYSYDEPALHGTLAADLQAVFDHVKALDADMPVIIVEKDIPDGSDAAQSNAYLSTVLSNGAYADWHGWSLYYGVSGGRTPYSLAADVADTVTVYEHYYTWLHDAFPSGRTFGVVQGFGVADQYSDEALTNTYTPEQIALIQAPDRAKMLGYLNAVRSCEACIWYGPGFLDAASETPWRDVLAATREYAA